MFIRRLARRQQNFSRESSAASGSDSSPCLISSIMSCQDLGSLKILPAAPPLIVAFDGRVRRPGGGMGPLPPLRVGPPLSRSPWCRGETVGPNLVEVMQHDGPICALSPSGGEPVSLVRIRLFYLGSFGDKGALRRRMNSVRCPQPQTALGGKGPVPLVQRLASRTGKLRSREGQRASHQERDRGAQNRQMKPCPPTGPAGGMQWPCPPPMPAARQSPHPYQCHREREPAFVTPSLSHSLSSTSSKHL